MKKNRVIIAGSRHIDEFDISFTNKVLSCMSSLVLEDTEIVSGGCRGADKLGERISDIFGYKLKRFPADWDKYGKGAGYVRNKAMAEYGTHLIALWDGVSKGTAMMIDLAKDKGLKIRIIKI